MTRTAYYLLAPAALWVAAPAFAGGTIPGVPSGAMPWEQGKYRGYNEPPAPSAGSVAGSGPRGGGSPGGLTPNQGPGSPGLPAPPREGLAAGAGTTPPATTGSGTQPGTAALPREGLAVEPAAPAAPAEKYTLQRTAISHRHTAEESTAVFVMVHVPASAQVWIEDKAMPAEEGRETRLFSSPALDPAKGYEYTVKVRWQENGKWVSQTDKFPVKAGDVVAVDVVPKAAAGK